jgi:hypothetical protein
MIMKPIERWLEGASPPASLGRVPVGDNLGAKQSEQTPAGPYSAAAILSMWVQPSKATHPPTSVVRTPPGRTRRRSRVFLSWLDNVAGLTVQVRIRGMVNPKFPHCSGFLSG